LQNRKVLVRGSFTSDSIECFRWKNKKAQRHKKVDKVVNNGMKIGNVPFGWVWRRNPSESLMMQQEEEEVALAISASVWLIESVCSLIPPTLQGTKIHK